jgi:Concanavalin A-like lectin/glucanases superfamily
VAWLLAAILLIATGLAVACFWPGRIDAAVLKQLRKPLTLWARGNIRPEPLERRIYLVLTLLSPAAALAGCWWAGLIRIRRSGRDPVNSEQSHLDSVSGVAGVGLALVAMAVMLTLEFPSMAEVFRPLSSPDKLPCAVAGGLVLATMASSISLRWRQIWMRRRFATCLHWIALAAVGGLIVARVAAMGIFDGYHTRRLGPMDWNTVFYGVSQAAAGARPMFDFTAQYGYYSALLKPWFALTGLSVLTFTATMAVLQGFSMACIGWVLWRLMRSAGLLVLCMAALGWLMVTWLGIYFAYYPIRLLFPAVSVLAVYCYMVRPTAARAAGFGALLGGPGVWWNLDSGVVALGSWVCVLAIEALSEQLRGTPTARTAWRRAGIGVGAAALGFAAIYLALSADAWRFLNLRQLVRFQEVFYISGFCMLPMPLAPHLWEVIAGIYLAGLIYGLSGAIRAGRLAPGAGMILHLSVLGTGLFAYYQGRSHDYNLVHACWPAVCLAFLFADRLLAAARLGLLPRVFAAGALPAALLGGACLVCSWEHVPSVIALHWSWLREGFSRNPPSSLVTDAAQYIASAMGEPNAPGGHRSKGDSNCAILSPNQATYFAMLGMRSALQGPSIYETFLKRDFDDLDGQLRSRRIRHLFVEDRFPEGGGTVAGTEALIPLEPDFMKHILGWYQILGQNAYGNVLHLGPRATLDQDPETTFAREFAEQARLSRGAMDAKHAVAFAPAGVLLDTRGECVSFLYQWDCRFQGDFTLEIVFRPRPSQPDGACLVSNRSETGLQGFAVRRIGGEPDAFVLELGDGSGLVQSDPFTAAPDRDNYLALVRRGGQASVFINGRALAAPTGNFSNGAPLTFGNSKYAAHPFQGQILEVQWSPKGLAAEELDRTWRGIAPASP